MASERFQRRIDRILDQIEDAADRRDWGAVHQGAEDVLIFDPDNADALNFLAAAVRALGSALEPASSQQQTENASELPTTSHALFEAERRQLTVMFCDLQESTALSQHLDPEQLRDVIRSYQEVCAGAVGRFEGHIAKYLGDGLLVYFGYPQAHEDDPQRAVRAGLAIVEDMKALNTRLRADRHLELAVRIGVHTGLVVAGEMGSGESIESLAIVGETPNIAARLQEVAEPDSVVISSITANLVQGFFRCYALGFNELKGISEPMEMFSVLSESGAQTRFDVAATARLTPLVGRDQEVGLLLDRWEQAKEGLGQVVLLSGEPGIGKSRLINELTERLAQEPLIVRQLRCSAYHQNSALHPIVEYLESWLGFGPGDSSEIKLDKLKSALATQEFPMDEAMPLMAGILSIQLDERYLLPTMNPEEQRARTLELVVALLLDSVKDEPVFIVVEDLHWADPSTLAVLGLLIDQAPTASVLALLSFRPEFTPPWGSRAYLTPILLNRLTRRLAGDMIQRLTDTKPLPAEVLIQVTAKSDGVPLFVEELTRMVIESELVHEVEDHYELTGLLPSLAIPTTLQDALTARLDSLGSAREVVQLGAVLGREFSYELLRAVCSLEEDLLKSHLQHLITGEFLYQRGQSPDATYIFKHALIQDAAYESLLRTSRQQYHQRIALVLEDKFPQTTQDEPELLAHHFAEADSVLGQDKLVRYSQLAGERALAVYAYEEAFTHFERGLVARDISLSGTESASDEEAAALLFGLGRAQIAMNNGPAAVDSLNRASDYYVKAGDVDGSVAVAECTDYSMGQSSQMNRLITRALELVPSDSHQAGRLLYRYGRYLGMAGGNDSASRNAFDRALAIARRQDDEALEMRTLVDATGVDIYHLRWEEAIGKGSMVIELARHADDPRSTVAAHYFMVSAFVSMGNLEEAREHASAMLAPAQRLRDRFWLRGALWKNGIVSRLTGDWAASREYSDRCLEFTRGADEISDRILLECEVGDFDQGEAHLERFVERANDRRSFDVANGYVAMTIPLYARITGKLDRMSTPFGY